MSWFKSNKLTEQRKIEYQRSCDYYNKVREIANDNNRSVTIARAIYNYYKLPIDNHYTFLNKSEIEILDLFKEIGILPEVAYNKCIKCINDSIAYSNKLNELNKEYEDLPTDAVIAASVYSK